MHSEYNRAMTRLGEVKCRCFIGFSFGQINRAIMQLTLRRNRINSTKSKDKNSLANIQDCKNIQKNKTLKQVHKNNKSKQRSD